MTVFVEYDFESGRNSWVPLELQKKNLNLGGIVGFHWNYKKKIMFEMGPICHEGMISEFG